MPNLEDITDPTTAMNMELVLMAKAFKLNYSTPTNNNQRISSNPRNRQIAQPGNQVVQNAVQNSGVQNIGNQNRVIIVPGIANQNGNGNVVAARAEGNANGNNGNQIRCYNYRGLVHLARNFTVRPRRRDVAYLQTLLLIAQKKKAGIQLQAEEFDLMAVVTDLDEIEEVNANCILMENLQQASTSGTRSNMALVYDSDGSAEVHDYNNCYNNEIFNMFTQEEQYTELLEPIPKPHQVPQNESNFISKVSSLEQGGGTVEQHSANVEETRAYHESLFHNLVAEVEKVNSVNRKMKETNAELTTELARYKNQERCFEISQEKYEKLERCYQQSVYQEQCLSKKINAIHLSSEEKKRLKSDFKIREDEFLDKQIQLENKIKDLDNIFVKTGQSIQTMHMLSPKPDSFYHSEHKMDFGYQNPFYLKQAQQKQQSLYNGKVLLEKHDPPAESLAKHNALELEIERLLRAVVSQDIMSIVQNNSIVYTSNLQTELERTKERFEDRIIKKENEYAKLWNDWYKKCEECKYDKISYDKAYNDMQQKIERLQAQLGYQKGKSKDTSCVSNTLDPLPQKLENENVELEFWVQNYKKENAYLKTVINPFKNSRKEKLVPNKQTKASIRTNPITVTQPHVIIKDVLNSAKYYTDSDWNDILSQVHANQGLTADLLGPDVTEDNFAERMVALITKRRREFVAQRFQDKRNKPMTYAQQNAYMRTFVKNQSSTIYTTGWNMKHVKSFSDDQLKTEFDKIRTAAAELQSLNIKRSLKRPGADLEQASSKKSKSTEVPKYNVPADSQQPSVEVPSQKATLEDVEVPSTTAFTAQPTASTPKKVGTRRNIIVIK
ncbi:hypothetical protein Tco_0838230 [Tanacetum coccineum]|uniref:Gag-Pol polyprotein n=1 Tax=Tanacetum coccineum TaxID=301880 RepID=A0ABQ5ARG0_9ASTR